MPTTSTRAFTRVPAHIEAVVRDAHGVEARGTLRDLSLNGLSIAADVPMEAGAPCRVRFFLGTGAEPIPVDARGTVVRSSDGVVAVRIDAVDPGGYEHFGNLVLYNAPDAAAFEREALEHADEQPAVDPGAGEHDLQSVR